MAASSAQRSKRAQGAASQLSDDDSPIGSMHESIGSMERPVPGIDNPAAPSGRKNARSIGDAAAAPTDRSFTTTFAVAAIVLLIAFMIALYLGTRGTGNMPQASQEAPQAPATVTSPPTVATPASAGASDKAPVSAPAAPAAPVSGATGSGNATNP